MWRRPAGHYRGGGWCRLHQETEVARKYSYSYIIYFIKLDKTIYPFQAFHLNEIQFIQN